jgi:hypothetical protein
MLLGRSIEFRSGGARTGAGEPATIGPVRRYDATASLLGLGLWVLADGEGHR